MCKRQVPAIRSRSEEEEDTCAKGKYQPFDRGLRRRRIHVQKASTSHSIEVKRRALAQGGNVELIPGQTRLAHHHPWVHRPIYWFSSTNFY
jgi:hypothetical protein